MLQGEGRVCYCRQSEATSSIANPAHCLEMRYSVVGIEYIDMVTLSTIIVVNFVYIVHEWCGIVYEWCCLVNL